MVIEARFSPREATANGAFVIARTIAGWQAKNQIPPAEEPFYVADGGRRLSEIDGVPFGITICREFSLSRSDAVSGCARGAAGHPPASHPQRPDGRDPRSLG